MKFREGSGNSSQPILPHFDVLQILLGVSKAAPVFPFFFAKLRLRPSPIVIIGEGHILLFDLEHPFAPTRAAARPSRGAAVKTGRSSAAAVGLVLTAASTVAPSSPSGCRVGYTPLAHSFRAIVVSAAGGVTRMCRDAEGGSVARPTSGRAIAPGRGRLRPRAAQALELPKDRIVDQQRSIACGQHLPPKMSLTPTLHQETQGNPRAMSTTQFDLRTTISLKSID